jgi:hypothetical protein
MKHLGILLIIFNILNAQQIVRVDTLHYNDVTGIVSIVPNESREIIILGGHCSSYSNPDNSTGRTFLIKTNSNNALNFLDSTIGGVGAMVGPAAHKDNIYIAVWLNALNNQIPKLGGTAVDAGIYVLKYNTMGNLIWYKKQDFHAMPSAIAVDAEGFVYVNYSGGIGFNRKYTPNGDMLESQYPAGCSTFDRFGNFYGHFDSWLYKFDPSGKELAKLNIGQAAFSPDDEGNIYTFEYLSQLNHSQIRKLAPNGIEIWKVNIPLICAGPPLIEQYNVYIGGFYQVNSTGDWFGVYKIDYLTGEVIWQSKLSSSFPTREITSFSSTNGYVYIACKTWDPGVGDARLTRIKDLSFIPVTTGVKEVQKKSAALNLVPNPTNKVVTLYMSGEISDAVLIKVTDITGRVVLQREVENTELEPGINLEVSHLSAGMYNLQVLSNNIVSGNAKLVIER